MGKLNDTKLRAIKPTGKVERHSDGDGLYLYVSKSGGMLWRMDYTNADGKRKTFSFGKYPALSLANARKRLLEVKEQCANGIDPSAHKKAVKASRLAEVTDSFEAIAREWHENIKSKWTEKHQKTVIERLKKNIFPFLGGTPIKRVTPPDLLAALRKIEARGAIETAHRVLGICSQVFCYAVATGRVESDPSRDLRTALKPVTHVSLPALTDPKDIGVMLRLIDEYKGNAIVRIALQIAPYVFVRPSELRCATWDEFNLEEKQWLIPAHRMKRRREHLVPLSDQVVKLLDELFHYSGHAKYLFPSMRTDTAPISDATLLAGLRRMGYSKDEACVHGFRHMASTILNELEYNPDHIEMQLAHIVNDVRGTYNKAQYLPQRKKMMQEWANYLDGLKAEG